MMKAGCSDNHRCCCPNYYCCRENMDHQTPPQQQQQQQQQQHGQRRRRRRSRGPATAMTSFGALLFTTLAMAASSSASSIQPTEEQVSTKQTIGSIRRNTIANNCATPYTSYQAGHVFNAGDLVSYNDKNYQCNPWPNTPYCSNTSYAPSVSTYWKMAWTVSLID
jgi:hypothetical protein